MLQEQINELFKNLSNEKRRRLLRQLRGKSMPTAEIAELVGSSLTNVARDYIDPLAEIGLIEAYPDPSDTRRKLYRITNLGAEIDNMSKSLERTGPVVTPPQPEPTAPTHPKAVPVPYLLLYNSGYIVVWGIFILSARGVLAGLFQPWIAYAWFFLASVASVIWFRFERGPLRRIFPPPQGP